MAQNNWNSNLYQDKHSFVTQYGNDIVELLVPQADETILDLGCGNGELSAKIAECGAKVYGVDFASEMIDKASKNFPHIRFMQHDSGNPFPFDFQFDAIFSNAALHWMTNPQVVIKNMATSLKDGGRLVFEMGGKGNIQTIIKSIEAAAQDYNLAALPIYNYFPSLSEYASLLEQNGFRVVLARHFDRPTKLEGQDGLRNWVKMFRNSVLAQLAEEQHDAFLSCVEKYAQEKLYINNIWTADYVRLRMMAIKK